MKGNWKAEKKKMSGSSRKPPPLGQSVSRRLPAAASKSMKAKVVEMERQEENELATTSRLTNLSSASTDGSYDGVAQSEGKAGRKLPAATLENDTEKVAKVSEMERQKAGFAPSRLKKNPPLASSQGSFDGIAQSVGKLYRSYPAAFSERPNDSHVSDEPDIFSSSDRCDNSESSPVSQNVEGTISRQDPTTTTTTLPWDPDGSHALPGAYHVGGRGFLEESVCSEDSMSDHSAMGDVRNVEPETVRLAAEVVNDETDDELLVEGEVIVTRKKRVAEGVVVICMVVIAVSVIVGVVVGAGTSSEETNDSTGTRQPSAPTQTLTPPPTRRCFDSTTALLNAVDEYLLDSSPNTSVAETYGWPIGSWCVPYITDFTDVFSATRNPMASTFNEDLAYWDLSGAHDLTRMFNGAAAFNQDLSAWKVAEVTSMNRMFAGSTTFNQDISSWDVSRVTDMNGMFTGASAFNRNISAWDVSSVKDLEGMFSAARSFNQNIDRWDISAATNMDNMFNTAHSFNNAISSWNISNVKSLSGTFRQALAFNQDLSLWDVSNVVTMRSMFDVAESFNMDVSSWEISQVEDMSSMFRQAKVFDRDLSAWDVSRVKEMSRMFEGAVSFDQDLSAWDVSRVTSTQSMFQDAMSFNRNIATWNISSVTDFRDMFAGASNFSQDLCAWGLAITGSAVKVSGMFTNTACWKEEEVDLAASPPGPFCMECV